MSNNIMSSRVLSSFDISEELLTKLTDNGCHNKMDIETKSEQQLRSLLSLNDDEWHQIDSIILQSSSNKYAIKSVNECVAQKYEFIRTGSKSMDRLLSGGLQLSRLTQLFGEAGSGKSQICMQLCVSVQLPPHFGGVSGEVLYIDTEKQFRPDRVKSMAKSVLNCRKREFYGNEIKLSNELTVDYISAHIYHKLVDTDAQSLLDVITNQLDSFLERYPKVRLIIIDSIAYLFRYDYTGKKKSYELSQIAAKLKNIAISKNIAILLTNQVTYDLSANRNVPALGSVLQSSCSTIIEILRPRNTESRSGRLLKSPLFSEYKNFYFSITESGIKDAE